MRAGLVCVFIVLCGASLLVGARQMAWSQVFSLSGDDWLTLTASRLPRLAALVLTGVGLSVCGVILQHVVRNKFVEPATSGGLDAAKFGILVSLTLAPAAGTAARMLFALVFCLAASLLFVAIVRRVKFKNTVLVPVIGLMYGVRMRLPVSVWNTIDDQAIATPPISMAASRASRLGMT